MDCRPYGDRGVLLSALSDAERAGLLSALERALPEQCFEFVPGYDSILLVGTRLHLVETWLGGVSTEIDKQSKRPRCHRISVHYDGVDLQSVAEACAMPVTELIQRHSAPAYTVRMMGFSPGFPYLDGLDPKLHLARRDSPRNHIPPGTVAIGGAHAGIYSVASPGGWHQLGRTDRSLFNLEAAKDSDPDPDHVFTLKVGDEVRFQAITDR